MDEKHFTFIDEDGVLWIEIVCCKYCRCFQCTAIALVSLNGLTFQCAVCGNMIKFGRDTYLIWTDDSLDDLSMSDKY